MEAASATAASIAPSGAQRAAAAVRGFLSAYGLIIVLVALPAYFGIRDLSEGHSLARLAENLKDGISNGAIWALIALGYTLVYGIIELINFAHGDVFMLGSFTAAGLYGTFGLTESTGGIGLVIGLVAVLLVSMVVSGSLNAMIERVAYRPLRGAPKLAPLITAVGFSFILQNVGLLWHGGAQLGVPDLVDSQKQLVNVLGVSITHGDVLAIVITVPLLAALGAFVRTSRLGKAMRATAQDPEAARLMGINVDTTISVTFTAAVMGGIGNLQGAVLGGFIIGCIQQVSDNRIGGAWTPAVVFVYLVLIMVLRPQGLLGEQTREAG